MSNNKQSSVYFYRIESQKLIIKALRNEITRKEWVLLENKLGEQAEAMHREEIVNAVDGFPIHARHLNGEEYYNEHYGNTNRN